MKLDKLQKVLVVFLSLWACVYPVLLCSSFRALLDWSLEAAFSNVCYSAFCTPNRPVPPMPMPGGLAGFVVDNPLTIPLTVLMYIALIIFYFRLWRTHRGRLAESKTADAQFDKGLTEKKVASNAE